MFLRSNPLTVAGIVVIAVLSFFAGYAYAEPAPKASQTGGNAARSVVLAPVPAYISGGDVAVAGVVREWQVAAWLEAVAAHMLRENKIAEAGASARSGGASTGDRLASQAGGTKASPQPSGSSGDISGFLACTRAHESDSAGGYQAISPDGRYRGAYQFDQQTWNGVGGTGDPAAASPAEQDYRATILYEQRGNQPWGGRC
jgi:hypothetical protein